MEMETKRVVLGSNPGLNSLPDIPIACQRDRTVVLTPLKVLVMWPDRRPEAIRWLEEVIPHMILGVMPKVILKAFWEMPPGSWWEFDFHRKTLSFCWIEKK